MRDEGTPFAVEVRLASPVSLNHPWLHLDGLLTHLARNRVMGRDQYNAPTKEVRSLTPEELGPYRHLLVRSPVPQGSISFFGPVERLCSLQFFKRFEERGFPRANKIAMGFGHFRAWMMRVVYVPAEWAVFYGRGNIDLVRDLLGDLTHLGNKSRMGWGAVSAVTVTEMEENWALTRDGVAMRPIPVRYLASWSDAVPLAWRPPYWSPDNVDLCAPPGAEVELLSSRKIRALAGR